MGKRGHDSDAASKKVEKVEKVSDPQFEVEDLDVSSSESDDEPAAVEEGGDYDSEESAGELKDEEEEEDDEDGDDDGAAGLESSDDEIDRAVLDLVQRQEGEEAQPPEQRQDRSDRTADAGTSEAAGNDSDSSDDERPNRNTGTRWTLESLCTSSWN